MSAHSWSIVLSESLRERAVEIACEIAARLRDPDQTQHIAEVAIGQMTTRSRRFWVPFSNTFGFVGTALLFGQLDRCFPAQGWDQVAHRHLSEGVRGLEGSGSAINLALFGGLAGVCFTVRYLSHGGTRYRHLSKTLDEVLISRGEGAYCETGGKPGRVAFADYDLISGPVGLAAYLLTKAGGDLPLGILQAICQRLMTLSGEQEGQLGFFIPAELQASEEHRKHYASGCTDLGLAHGVPGPLILFALATPAVGEAMPGLRDRMRSLASWIVTHQQASEWGVDWPYAVAPSAATRQCGPTRTAWCYGIPGVARALWAAGRVLDDHDLQRRALDAIGAVHQRPTAERGIASPILCHGIAGLLQVVLRFANEANSDDLATFASNLTEQLIDLYSSDSAIGFRNTEPDGTTVDDPGFLEGASGIALALLAASTDIEPAWDRLLLLS